MAKVKRPRGKETGEEVEEDRVVQVLLRMRTRGVKYSPGREITRGEEGRIAQIRGDDRH
jgi:hypothetical protein